MFIEIGRKYKGCGGEFPGCIIYVYEIVKEII